MEEELQELKNLKIKNLWTGHDLVRAVAPDMMMSLADFRFNEIPVITYHWNVVTITREERTLK